MDEKKTVLEDKKCEQTPKTENVRRQNLDHNVSILSLDDLLANLPPSPLLPTQSPKKLQPQKGTSEAAGAGGNVTVAGKPTGVIQELVKREQVPKISLKELLKEIALKNQFDVVYYDLEETTLEGEYECMVELSTFPIGVSRGRGATAEDARIHAAENALEYLKIIKNIPTLSTETQ